MLCTWRVLDAIHNPDQQRCYLVWLAQSVQRRTETRKLLVRIIVITRQVSHHRLPFVLVIKGEQECAEENSCQAASDYRNEKSHTSPTGDWHKRFNDKVAILASSHDARIQSLKR